MILSVLTDATNYLRVVQKGQGVEGLIIARNASMKISAVMQATREAGVIAIVIEAIGRVDNEGVNPPERRNESHKSAFPG